MPLLYFDYYNTRCHRKWQFFFVKNGYTKIFFQTQNQLFWHSPHFEKLRIEFKKTISDTIFTPGLTYDVCIWKPWDTIFIPSWPFEKMPLLSFGYVKTADFGSEKKFHKKKLPFSVAPFILHLKHWNRAFEALPWLQKAIWHFGLL